MSTNPTSGDFFGLQAGVPARVVTGSPVRLFLLCAPNELDAPDAARAMVKRHLPIRDIY
jgi:hypothetical protein